MTGTQERSLSLPRVASGVLACPQNREKLDSCFMDKETGAAGCGSPHVTMAKSGSLVPAGPVPDAAHLLQLLARDQPIRGGKDTATRRAPAFVEGAEGLPQAPCGCCHETLGMSLFSPTTPPSTLPLPRPRKQTSLDLSFPHCYLDKYFYRPQPISSWPTAHLLPGCQAALEVTCA